MVGEISRPLILDPGEGIYRFLQGAGFAQLLGGFECHNSVAL